MEVRLTRLLDSSDEGSQVLPKYLRLKNFLVGNMAGGIIRPGDALPSDREIAESTGISRGTVRQALAQMEQEGLINRKQGRRTIVANPSDLKLRRHPGGDLFGLAVYDIRSSSFSSMLHGFETVAASCHCQTITSSTNNNVDKQAAVIAQLLDKGVGGVALVPLANNSTPLYQIRMIQQQGVPIVLCRRDVEGISTPAITIPYDQVGVLAARMLLDRGHRRIGYFGTYRNGAANQYLSTLRRQMKVGGEVPEDFVYFCNSSIPDEKTVLQGLRLVCGGTHRPTAIMASHDSLAEKIFLLLGTLGLNVPEDISLISFGDAYRNGAICEQLTSIVIDDTEIGRKAAEWLNEMRTGERDIHDAEKYVMPLAISDGKTLGSVPQLITQSGKNGKE